MRNYLILGFNFLPSGLKIRFSPKPLLHKKYCMAVLNTPTPYFTLLEKLIEEASSKYFAGQDTSPIWNPK